MRLTTNKYWEKKSILKFLKDENDWCKKNSKPSPEATLEEKYYSMGYNDALRATLSNLRGIPCDEVYIA